MAHGLVCHFFVRGDSLKIDESRIRMAPVPIIAYNNRMETQYVVSGLH